jgi:hypothetical protein
MVVGPAPESSCAGGVVFLPTSRVPGPFIRDSSGVHRVDVGSAQGPASSSHFPMGLSETPDPCNAPLTGEARRGVGSNTRVCVSMYDPRRALRSYPRSRVLRLVASARWPFLHCPVAIIHRGFIVRCYCRRCPAATPQACTTQSCTRSPGSSWAILAPGDSSKIHWVASRWLVVRRPNPPELCLSSGFPGRRALSSGIHPGFIAQM